MPGGGRWPRISVVTPSYNQGQFIEQTIRSVLLQGYPDLEYAVMDGGSSDDSPKIIRKYERHLARWTSEPDRGQSHAINKGFERATGEILCWLNSDDYYAPGALITVAENLAAGAGTYALVGHCVSVFADGRPIHRGQGKYESLERLLQFWKGYHMHQPSIFWRREVFEEIGYLDEAQHYIMDFDYWVRIARLHPFKNIDQVLSYATYHAEAKTGDDFLQYRQELRRRAAEYWPRPSSLHHWRLRLSMFKHLEFLPRARRLKNSLSHRARQARRLLAGGGSAR